MDKRLELIKRNKNALKNLRLREDNRSFRIFIFSMIVGALNYVFWHDQFLKLDYTYDILFIVLPMIIGVILFYFINKIFIKNILSTKSSGLIDTVLSNGVLIIGSLFFAYYSIVTLANVIFKLSMDFSVIDKPIINKTYVVESTFRNDRGRGIHLFSSIYYLDEANEKQIFDVGVDAVTTSYENRKITFKCQEGFWGYFKILDYNVIHN